jgi:hypothetical protein
MIPEDRKLILNWSSSHNADAEVTFITSEKEADKPFDEFCNEFSSLAPQITIRKKSSEKTDPSPALQLLPNLIFQAIPHESKVPPFLQALERKKSALPSAVQETLEALQAPVFLKLYIARQCPFCPRTAADFMPLANASPFFHLKIIEADRFPDLAQQDKIQSVPTLILDDEFRWTGTIRIQEVTAMIANRDPAWLSASALEQIIKEGNAARLAEMMIAHQKIFPALVDLLVHSKWPSRLGSMVVAETIAEEDPSLAKKLTPLLWDRFSRSDSSVKGDILYVIGIAGGDKALALLQSVLESEEAPDVIEAAEDAVSRIKKNCKY